jgi:hypothetical protein
MALTDHNQKIQKAIQRVAAEYKKITYYHQDQNHQVETPYIILLEDALKFMGLEPITCLKCKSFMILRDGYLNNCPYATSDMDQDGHYIYRTNNGVKKLYFTVHGFKYFSLIYPSSKHSIIALYYISLESEYLRFSRDADGFLA